MTVATLATTVVAALRARGETLAVAESLTGGSLAAAIVDVTGASDVFRGGLVLYAVDLKVTLGGVPRDLIERRGPVHPRVAAAMADGARLRCAATWGLATTGVAGPDPHGGQPPGTVWLGLASPSGASTRQHRLTGDRAAVRAGSVRAALEWLAETLSE
jgi:nicotinamide-nucleotide amidase